MTAVIEKLETSGEVPAARFGHTMIPGTSILPPS